MTRRVLAVAAAASFVLSACTGARGPERTSPTPSPEPWRGGTLRIADAFGPMGLDPQKAYLSDLWELFRCCLFRTVLSYNGQPTERGGAQLFPDLASRMPDISADGLTWTFHLKPGLHYAPPFEDVEIVARDVVRALQREADPRVTPVGEECPSVRVCGYPFYYSVIEGFDEFRAGDSDTISGLETPDEHTLVVRLTRPTGDLGNRLAMPAAAPIPEGVTDGHDDTYGPFLVASGPYMIEGSQDLDFSAPPDEQVAVSGYTVEVDEEGFFLGPGSLSLVRNPSWDAATDDLRAAYVDRIEVTMPSLPETGGQSRRQAAELAAQVDSGALDLVFGWSYPPADQVRRYLGHPELRGRLLESAANVLQLILMNLAVPPFDDVHVRRAVNLVIDKEEIRERLNSGWFWRDGTVSSHIAPDSMEANLLLDYRPSWAPSERQDLETARDEMRRSAYDTDGDGRCDDPSCRAVLALVQARVPDERTDFGWLELVRGDLLAIGIDLDARVIGDVWRLVWKMAPGSGEKWGLALCTACGWIPDFPNGSNYFDPILYGPRIAADALENVSLLGATSEQLRTWGYEVTDVPSADVQIERCLAMSGQAQMECWAELDWFLMEEVVPFVPILIERTVIPVSDRVIQASIDQFTGYPALDRIALVEGSE